MPQPLPVSTPRRDPTGIFVPLARPLAGLERFILDQCAAFEPGVADCARYVVGNQGKRLRPVLGFLSARACDGRPLEDAGEDLLRACAIVEMVHIATLVHDDIMDGAALRRSRLTAGAKWGKEISVLLGDCLFAQALVLAASFPTPAICRRVAEAANLVCSGEILQTQRRFDLKLSEADYLRIIEMKTGSLFALAAELGARQGGASETRAAAFRDFGRLLGAAYQIYDDCLDLVGAEKEIGKSLGSDLQEGKLTLPVLLLLREAKDSEHHLVSSILLNEHMTGRALLLEFLRKHDAIRATAQRARDLLRQAAACLDGCSDNPGRQALAETVAYLDGKMAELK
ncbi:MAG: polyprenyl synthetase family protein [Verrucomicrobiae bacterium]|nr:polyprenyl synthetase family protein [Verrucomicrobiae bacterium]